MRGSLAWSLAVHIVNDVVGCAFYGVRIPT